MIRTAALIAAFLFFTAQGARAGDTTLAANAVLNNFLLVSAFFLDGLANAAEQLCGQAYGARDRSAFSGATRLVVQWGLAFAIVVAILFALFGAKLIDVMTASEDVRRAARDYLVFVALSPLLSVFAFAFDGVYIGATWARDMRNLMLTSLAIFLGTWFALRSFGNAGLWAAQLAHYAARGGLQALRYPSLLESVFQQEQPVPDHHGLMQHDLGRIPSVAGFAVTDIRYRKAAALAAGSARRRVRAGTSGSRRDWGRRAAVAAAHSRARKPLPADTRFRPAVGPNPWPPQRPPAHHRSSRASAGPVVAGFRTQAPSRTLRFGPWQAPHAAVPNVACP
jgi:hypothetical protein